MNPSGMTLGTGRILLATLQTASERDLEMEWSPVRTSMSICDLGEIRQLMSFQLDRLPIEP
jgi:hypothetical protein